MATLAQREPGVLVADVERLLERIESTPDRESRQTALELVQALLELYGAGLERIVTEIAAVDDGRLAAALAADELVTHLLLLHGLHPVPLEQRVLDALDSVRPYLDSHGGGVELLGIEGGAVRLALRGSCSGCPSSAMTLKLAIENAIRKAAPEIEEVVAETEAAPPALLQIEIAPAAAGGDGGDGGWTMVGGLPELAHDPVTVREVARQPILFVAAAARRYAYRPGCPACERSLEGARLSGTELACPACASRFDVLRAGRCLDSPRLHLEPVPLLEGDDGLVRIALPVAA